MIKLTKKQTSTLDILENHSNSVTEVIYGGSAGSAKTFIGCYWLAKNCLKYPESRWGLGRSELKTLKRTALKTLFEVCKMQGLQQGVHYTYREQAGEIQFFNGSTIVLLDLAYLPSDADFDRLGGYELCGAFVDEIAQIRKKAWDVLKTRLRYKLKEFGIIGKLFGSLNPSKNWVYTYFYKPWKDKSLKSSMRFIQALPTDNPHLPESYLNVLRNLPKAERNRLYLGLWESDDETQLANQDAIIELKNNSWVKTEPNQAYYITADIARQGSDKAVIYVWKGLQLIYRASYPKSKITSLSEDIIALKNKYRIGNGNIIADEDGVGGGVVDIVRCKGFINNSKALNSENYQNLKTQCYYKLAQLINEGKILIEEDLFTTDEWEELIEELEQIKSAPSDDNKLKIISKDEVKSNIGRSPDWADALMMRMYFEINKNKGIYNLI